MAGLAGQQITWAEIGAYNRETFAGLSVWQKRLIRRLDDAYEAAASGKSPGKPTSTNVADIRASLRVAIAARKSKAAAEKGAET